MRLVLSKSCATILFSRSIISSCSSSILACLSDLDCNPLEASISFSFPSKALLTTQAAKTENKTKGRPALNNKLFLGSEEEDEDVETEKGDFIIFERCGNKVLAGFTNDFNGNDEGSFEYKWPSEERLLKFLVIAGNTRLDRTLVATRVATPAMILRKEGY